MIDFNNEHYQNRSRRGKVDILFAELRIELGNIGVMSYGSHDRTFTLLCKAEEAARNAIEYQRQRQEWLEDDIRHDIAMGRA